MTVCTAAHNLSQSWARSIHSTTSQPISIKSILPFSWRAYKFFFLLGFPFMHFILHTCHMLSPSYSLSFGNPNNIWWAVPIMKYLIKRFTPLPCYPVPLRHEYHPQHPILDHPQPTALTMSCITLSVVTLFQTKFVHSLLHISQPSHVLHTSAIAVFHLARPCSNIQQMSCTLALFRKKSDKPTWEMQILPAVTQVSLIDKL